MTSTGWPASTGVSLTAFQCFAFDKHPAALRVNPRKRVHRFAEHRFLAGADGFELRADALADDKDEKQRRHHRRRNDPGQRQTEARPGVAEQHQRAEEKRDDAARRQHAVRRRKNIRDEQHNRQPDQHQPGDVDRQDGRHVKHENQRNRPDDARQNRARTAQFADDAVNHHQHQNEHDLRPQEQLGKLLPRVHREFPRRWHSRCGAFCR